MCIGIFSFRAFDRRLARLAAPIGSGVRQGGRICPPPPPSGARSAEYPSGRGLIVNEGGGGAVQARYVSGAIPTRRRRQTTLFFPNLH